MVEEQNDATQTDQNQPAPQPEPPVSPQQPSSYSQGGKSSTGLDSNIAGLLCYLFGWVSGLIFFLIEKEDRSVRFHALQSLLLSGVFIATIIIFSIVGRILGYIPVIGLIVGLILGLASIVLWIGFFIISIIAMIKAYQGDKFKLPIIGDIAEKNVDKQI
jgi:uncharacterized membrane protein